MYIMNNQEENIIFSTAIIVIQLATTTWCGTRRELVKHL